MSYVSGFIPGDDWGRVCDVCARLRPGRTFRVVEGVWICDRHPSYVPRQRLDRVPYMELGAPKPLPSAKPWTPLDTYETAEAEVLNLISMWAPTDTCNITNGAPVAGTASVQAAAWSCLYLYDMIADAERPVRWTSLATTLLGTLADWLYAAQKAGPGVGGTNSDVYWGAYDRGGSDFWTEDSGAAGLALLRAYQVLGASKYLDAARACAWFLRGAQCGDKLASRPSSTDSAGSNAYHYGAWTHRITLNAGTYDFDHRYYPGDLIGLEFLYLFRAVTTDETIGSSSTTAVFNASRAATCSVAIAEALAFWTTGAFSVDDGAIVNGFSTTTPREYFDAYPLNKGLYAGRGSWQLQDGALSTGTAISALNWAVGLRAFNALGQDVATTFDWLVAFTSNSAYELATNTRTFGTGSTWNVANDRAVWASASGAYNAKTAPATLLLVRGTNSGKNGSSFYDLAAAGLLAPLYSARQRTSFTALKDQLVVPKPRWRDGFLPHEGAFLPIQTLGVCGLSFQPYTDASLNRTQSVRLAAMAGGVFREDPQAYTGRGH